MMLLRHSTCRWLLALGLLFTYASFAQGSSSSSTPPAKVLASLQQLSSTFLVPDPFVQAAPLTVALSCREGIVFAAVHTPEPLERHDTSDEARACVDPPHNRIHAIDDSSGVVLLPCGWRADGMRLVDRARAVAHNQTALWGSPLEGPSLPLELSRYMARCAAQSATRSLSCAMLMSAPIGRDSTSSKSAGSLWLVDATGAYPVRAHALGGGILSKKDEGDEERQVLASQVVARALAKRWKELVDIDEGSLPYFDMSIDSAMGEILSILRKEDAIGDNAIVELVSVEYPSGRIRRRHRKDFALSSTD